MTSATGKAVRRMPRWRRSAGFTLVEIMVVIAIVVTLFAFIIGGVAAIRAKAAEKASRAMVHKLIQYLDEYKRLTGKFPPDGIDFAVKNDAGTPLKGSACLYYFLAQKPVIARVKSAGKETIEEHPPVASFQQSELSKEDEDFPGARELVDGWANPIHYDNTEDGKFHEQGGEVHTPEMEPEDHPIDPRNGEFIVDGQNAVPDHPGIQDEGYDIWSHGRQGHEPTKVVGQPIATWNRE